MTEVKTYVCTFNRKFEVQIHAPDVKVAKVMADEVLKGFPKDTVTILSIILEGQTEPVESVSGGELSDAEKKMLARNDGLAKKVGALLPDDHGLA